VLRFQSRLLLGCLDSLPLGLGFSAALGLCLRRTFFALRRNLLHGYKGQ
jgi:hypothetical protein